MAILALYTGMRENEIAEVKLEDIHDNSHIYVPEAKTESTSEIDAVSNNCRSDVLPVRVSSRLAPSASSSSRCSFLDSSNSSS
jgi:integrase